MNWSFAEVGLVPPDVVTVTSTGPALAAGDTAVMDVGLLTVTEVAGNVPKLTVEPPLTNPEPVMVTVVPPLVPPEAGETPVTWGP